MSKLLEEKTTIFVIKEDVGAMISALGNVMNEFGHYDPSSSWHRAVIDSGGRKLWQQDVRAVLQSETSFFRNAKKGNVPFLVKSACPQQTAFRAWCANHLAMTFEVLRHPSSSGTINGVGSPYSCIRNVMKKLLTSLFIAVLGYVGSASAQPLMNYTYADIAYQWTHLDQSGLDGANGLDTKLSYSPIKHFALEGGYNYSSTSADFSSPGETFKFNLDQNVFTYGGAGWYSLDEKLDIVARVGGVHARAHASGSEYDDTSSDNGVYTGLTLRYLALEQLETDAFIQYDHINSDSWTYGVTGLYALCTNAALKGEVAMDDESNVALLGGVRLAM